ncbi:ABC transporter permease subunit [Nonomuraea harbinensis]|uniref:ABC transporter permease subunit n=1 Tax=Nonomuraea harbinensis TaxID=1286938 RepID=A0ABW1C0S5_9ACTN|nr:ABC transporter permease subunit [Nonomuraea harbinensis]
MIAKTLRDYRRALIGWTIGISAFMGLYLAVYGSVKENPEVYGPQAMAKFPGALKDLMGGMEDFTSGAGYLQSVVYQLFVPFLFLACAMLIANRALAQPEEDGTLELVVTLPIDRKRLVLERFAALVIGLGAVAAMTLLVTWGLAETMEMGVPFDRILAAHTGVLLVGLFFGAVTLAVGAATGRKGPAMAVTGVWAVLGYVVVTVGRSVDAIAWLKWLSPFHYYASGQPLQQGLPVGEYLVLTGAAAVLALTAVLAFDRRDVGV